MLPRTLTAQTAQTQLWDHFVSSRRLLDTSGNPQAVLVWRECYPSTIEREEVLEVRRGNAAVCGPFRPLVSLRSRRTALDVTKTGSSREPLSWVSWTTCRLYYSPVKWLAVVNVAATVRIPMCRPQTADPEVPGWTP